MTHNGAISRPTVRIQRAASLAFRREGCELNTQDVGFFHWPGSEMWTARSAGGVGAFTSVNVCICRVSLFRLERHNRKTGVRRGNKSRPLLRGHMSEVKAAPTETKTLSRPEGIETETRPRLDRSKKRNKKTEKKWLVSVLNWILLPNWTATSLFNKVSLHNFLQTLWFFGKCFEPLKKSFAS